MPYKDLEHNGGEDFSEQQLANRSFVEKLTANEEASEEEKEEETLKKLQEDWLNPENPFLWNGEI